MPVDDLAVDDGETAAAQPSDIARRQRAADLELFRQWCEDLRLPYGSLEQWHTFNVSYEGFVKVSPLVTE